MRYLCVTQDGGETLYPPDPRMRAKIDMIMDWRQTELYTKIAPIGYLVWGINMGDDVTKKAFQELMDVHFITLMEVYLKDTPFCLSDKPTIADLSIAPALTFLKVRKHMWAKVPEKVKEYRKRVLASFPDTKVNNFDMLDGMCTGYTGDGADLEP